MHFYAIFMVSGKGFMVINCYNGQIVIRCLKGVASIAALGDMVGDLFWGRLSCEFWG